MLQGPASSPSPVPPPKPGEGLVERLHALAESIRRQMSARRRNKARAGGPSHPGRP